VKISGDYNKPLRFFKDCLSVSPLFGRAGGCALFLLCTLVVLPRIHAASVPRELPVRVSIEALLSDEVQYDGHRIVVSGRIESLVFQQGHMGSPYLKIVLQESPSLASLSPQRVEVISLDFPKARAGDKVLVQGNYHISGRKVGRLFKRFIDAEVIVLDKF